MVFICTLVFLQVFTIKKSGDPSSYRAEKLLFICCSTSNHYSGSLSFSPDGRGHDVFLPETNKNSFVRWFSEKIAYLRDPKRPFCAWFADRLSRGSQPPYPGTLMLCVYSSLLDNRGCSMNIILLQDMTHQVHWGRHYLRDLLGRQADWVHPVNCLDYPSWSLWP